MIPLFERYPLLRDGLAYTPLAELPTPIQRLDKLGERLGIGELYVKRDDLSSKVYGGNKPRKLEFILGQAVRAGVSHVMTFGAAGSNHALATAIFSRQLGLESISMLSPQPNSRAVRRNLLLSHLYGAELHLCRHGDSNVDRSLVRASVLWQMFRHRMTDGVVPAQISAGGSSTRGVAAYVSAALELSDQIAAGALPQPDFIYVTCGTMGTAAGLILGLWVAGLPCRVVSVAVTGEDCVRAEWMVDLMHRTGSMLGSLDPSFPQPEFSTSDLEIRREYFGTQFGLFTDAGMQAVSLVKELEGIEMDGTYTGKTLAALIDDAGSGRLYGKSVLFWHTLNTRDFSKDIARVDYHELPRGFHRYFEEPVQPLDHD